MKLFDKIKDVYDDIFRMCWFLYDDIIALIRTVYWNVKKTVIERNFENFYYVDMLFYYGGYLNDNRKRKIYKTKTGYYLVDDENTTVHYNNEHKIHRLDGPAVEGDGYTKWYINGKRIYEWTEKEVNLFVENNDFSILKKDKKLYKNFQEIRKYFPEKWKLILDVVWKNKF